MWNSMKLTWLQYMYIMHVLFKKNCQKVNFNFSKYSRVQEVDFILAKGNTYVVEIINSKAKPLKKRINMEILLFLYILKICVEFVDNFFLLKWDTISRDILFEVFIWYLAEFLVCINCWCETKNLFTLVLGLIYITWALTPIK